MSKCVWRLHSGFKQAMGQAKFRAMNLETDTPANALTISHSKRDAATPVTSKPVTLRSDLRPGDLGWMIGRNGEVYAQEYAWNTEYEAFVAEICAGFWLSEPNPSRERAWIAEAGGVRLGCVFVVEEDAQTARLRMLLVDPLARGLGLGSRLVEECVSFARAAGYRQMVLFTCSVLTSARKIYRAKGFELRHQKAMSRFGQELIGEDWVLTL